MTKWLITKRGFSAAAVEADWPDAYRVNRCVRGIGADADANGALDGFKRFPTWMWRNANVLDFIGWLRAHNDEISLPELNVVLWSRSLQPFTTRLRRFFNT